MSQFVRSGESYGWTQPVCESCWAQTRPHRPVKRVPAEDRTIATCSLCGTSTLSGMYLLDLEEN